MAQATRGNDPATSYTGQASFAGQAAAGGPTAAQPIHPGQGAAPVRESFASSVTWASIIGGAFAAAAISIVLLALGSGFGLSSVMPFSYNNPSALSFTIGAIIWLLLTQWVASAIGGYLTGRMRTKWVGVHNREVLFRDIAHGLLTWAVATVMTVYVFAAATAAAAGGTAFIASTSPAGSSLADPTDYYIDALYRSNRPNAPVPDNLRSETKRILFSDLKNNQFVASDKAYLTQEISLQTGIAPVEAARRVDYVLGDLAVTTDNTRRAAENLSFITSISMLIGALIACAAAAYGGRHRDAIA